MREDFRTDLALEVKESFEEENVEIKGVILREDFDETINLKVTTVEICDSHGARAMKKPVGTYLTLEAKELLEKDENYHIEISKALAGYLDDLTNSYQAGSVLVVGLGNREATPDSLGPLVVDNLFVTRHIVREFGEFFENAKLKRPLCAVAPGVMAQTGMETVEILKGIVKEVKPAFVLVVDALAARSTHRLITTVQLTNTGICPGGGIGNNRQALNKESLGVDVIAIGVPTVVDAMTIVRDSMEQMLKQQEFSEEEQNKFFHEVTEQSKIEQMFVTPKNIDESVKCISYTISEAINACFIGKDLIKGETVVSKV